MQCNITSPSPSYHILPAASSAVETVLVYLMTFSLKALQYLDQNAVDSTVK